MVREPKGQTEMGRDERGQQLRRMGRAGEMGKRKHHGAQETRRDTRTKKEQNTKHRMQCEWPSWLGVCNGGVMAGGGVEGTRNKAIVIASTVPQVPGYSDGARLTDRKRGDQVDRQKQATRTTQDRQTHTTVYFENQGPTGPSHHKPHVGCVKN